MTAPKANTDALLETSVALARSLSSALVIAFPPGISREEASTIAAGHVVGYVRVSTEEQAAADSPRAQIEALVGQGRPAHLPAPTLLVIECGSGADPDRPGIAFAVAVKPAILTCTKVDRLDRHTLHFLGILDLLEDFNTNLSIQQVAGLDYREAAGKYVLTVLMAGAEFERALGSQRTSSGMMARGGKSGLSIPQRARIFALRYAGNSVREIATTVSKEFGRSVAISTIHYLLKKAIR
jgi:DNA invertase Pin-like site-specific DNA recombinase